MTEAKAKPPETAAEMNRVLSLVEEHGQTGAAKKLGIARQTLQGWLARAEARPETVSSPAVPDVREQEVIGLRDSVRTLRAELSGIHRDNLTAAVVREHILGLSAHPASPPGWLMKESKKRGYAGVPSTLWSDWHWGEVVDPAQINGVNAYNLEIAHARSRTLVERLIDLCFNHMTGADYPGIVVNLGGDMISGDIHAELTETNELPIMPTILDLFGVLVWSLDRLLERFPRVFVNGVPGNHGRNTLKPRMKNRVYQNFDWLLYGLLERHYLGNARIAFNSPSTGDAYFNIYQQRYLLTHGDTLGVHGGDGIIGALGPILRGTFKTRNSSAAMGLPFDTIMMGHWHQRIAMDRVIVNSCLKGFDEFAKNALRASPEPASQNLWWTHPKHGITCAWPIYVDDSKAISTNEWVTWAQEAA